MDKKKTIKNSIIFIIIVLILIIGVITIQKIGIIEIAKNRIEELKQTQIETQIQGIIDETKTQVMEAEQREATILDVKEKLKEKGYDLNETTGEVKYNEYYVTINDDLTIASVEKIVTKAKYEIMSQNEGEYGVLITIENKHGIEKITGSDIKLECKGREKVALDRTLSEGEAYQIRVKLVGKEKEELHTLVASKKPNIIVSNIDTLGDGTTKTINIEYPNNENLINYYSLDDGETWQKYTQELNILETDNKTITAKSEWKEGKTIENTEEKVSLIVSDSLLSASKNAIMKNDTHYRIAVKDEEYNVHTYIEEGDITVDNTKVYGNANDVGTANEYAKYTVLVKINGNLTIKNNATLTAYGTQYGGPKGMLLYVTGNLENNGTITMTARGAKAEGQNIYLWKNQNKENGEYEFVPKEGANGAKKVEYTGTIQKEGLAGEHGEERATGGGGSGGVFNGVSELNIVAASGGKGTSYSGGAAGGASSRYRYHSGMWGWSVSENIGKAGEENGGAGGEHINNRTSGAGAGNPGGNNGTGGTLVIFASTFNNVGEVTSNGSQGGQGAWDIRSSSYTPSGGGSGRRKHKCFLQYYNSKRNDKCNRGNRWRQLLRCRI